MRPDKKKNRHHDSVKCENKAKQKASEKAKKEEKSQHQKKQQQQSATTTTKDKENSSSSSKNENVSSTTPNEEVFEKTMIPDNPKYSKRSVTSNWTKYEIPSDDDNCDEFGTGPEFQFVMEKSAQAADHLMLSSEKQWQKEEPEIANQQQNEHFALNLKNLETALDCIPLYDYDMFHMKKCEIDKETITTMDAYAKQGQEILRKKLQNDYESVDEVNKKIVENLVIAKKKQSKNLDENMAKQGAAVVTSARKKDDKDDLEDWLNDYLSD